MNEAQTNKTEWGRYKIKVLWSNGNESEMSNKTNHVQISPLNLLHVHVTEHKIISK